MELGHSVVSVLFSQFTEAAAALCCTDMFTAQADMNKGFAELSLHVTLYSTVLKICFVYTCVCMSVGL